MTSDDNFAAIVKNNYFEYIPSCLLAQMISNCYSQFSKINIASSRKDIVPDMLALVEKLTLNFRMAKQAYSQTSATFFYGDWKKDQARANALLYEIMSRLGYVGELVSQDERKKIYEIIKNAADAWAELNQSMDEKMRRRAPASANGIAMYYLRNENAGSWQRAMANSILWLDANSQCDGSGKRLLLVCYKRVRNGLLHAIEDLERSCKPARRFAPEKIVHIYEENMPVICPNCTHMTSYHKNGTRKAIRGSFFKARHEENTRSQTQETTSSTVLPLPPSVQWLISD